MKNELRFRQVHLDFHTSGLIPDVGADFDAEAFAKALEDAHVDSVTCFSRCHHGWLYYDSQAMPERVHPHLKNRNLLGKQIDACHRRGIKAPVYTTVQWDEQTADEHPEWLVRNEVGAPFNQPTFQPGFYRNLCLNSGYVDFLKAQIRDLFACLGELDGLFLDILNIKPCCCVHCLKDMADQGLDAQDETVRYQFAQQVFERFQREMTAFIHDLQPGCPVFYNAGFIGTRHRAVLDAYTHLEIESLPGGSWGYAHFPVTARYARTLGLDFLGMTGKFHTDWGDFGSFRNQAALEYECFKSLAYGGKCSIGDQLHPSGALTPATYDLIGAVYGQVAQKEPWCRGAAPVVEAAVLAPEEFKRPGTLLVSPELNGAVKLMTHLNLQFNVIDSREDFAKYRLLVLPDDIPVAGRLADKLEDYLRAGGKVIASHRAGLDESGAAFASFLPVDFQGEAPYSPDYAVAEGALADGLAPDTEYVMYLRALRVAPRAGARTLLRANVPYFNRTWQHYCSHRQTPSSGQYGYPAAVGGEGVIYFAHPVFATYEKYGCRWLRTLVGNAVRALIGPTMVAHRGPSTLEICVNEQEPSRRLVLHALHYVPERRCEALDIVEDVIPLYDTQIELRTGKKIVSAQLVPQGVPLAVDEIPGGVRLRIPLIEGHQMVALHY